MRVRLYWSLARLAAAEGRGAVALTNIRKAIALLETTEDALNLARAHILAAKIDLTRSERTVPSGTSTGPSGFSACPPNQDLDRGEDPPFADRRAARRRRRAQSRSPVTPIARRLEDGRPRRGALPRSRDGLALARRSPKPTPIVQRSGRPARSGRLVASGRERLPRLGAHAPRQRTRGRGARRPRPRRRPRHARDAADTRRALTFELAVEPRGPYSLALSARTASDATRTFRDGLLTQALAVDGRVELARAWQSPDGVVTIRAESAAAAERVRWLLALDDDHSGFLVRVRDDRLLGRASRELRGLRPVRVPTVAHALLRAFCGQLIEAKRARRLEQTIVRALCAAGPENLHVSPTAGDLGALAPSQLRRLGLHARRAAVARAAVPVARARAAARRADGGDRRAGSSANAVSGRGRSASSASKGSAASTTVSSGTSASSSSCAHCAAVPSRAGRRRSCSRRTGNGAASRASICSPATPAGCSRSTPRPRPRQTAP